MTGSIKSVFGIPQDIYVTSVREQSAASKVGITVKTAVTRFDGVRVTNLSNLENRLPYYAAGETVDVTL